MREYPLFFESSGPISGPGYDVSVRVRGSVLATWDEDAREFVLSGVNPGSLLGFGNTLNEACQDTGEALRCILKDIAAGAVSVEDFRREAEDFFHTGAPRCKARWEAARERARQDPRSKPLDHRVGESTPKQGIFVEPIGETPSQRKGWSFASTIDNVEGALLAAEEDEDYKEFLEDLHTARRVMREYREHGLKDTVPFTQFRADRREAKQ